MYSIGLPGLAKGVRRLLPTAYCLVLTAYGLLPTLAHAQGCAMCYTSASAAKSAGKAALFNGTLILLGPPIVIFAIVIVVIFRYRNRFRDVTEWRPQHDRELRELLANARPAATPETEIWHDPSVVSRL